MSPSREMITSAEVLVANATGVVRFAYLTASRTANPMLTPVVISSDDCLGVHCEGGNNSSRLLYGKLCVGR